MLRDGIEDYEYLVILKGLLGEKQRQLPDEARGRYALLLTVPESVSRSLTSFTSDPAPIEAHRHGVAEAIEALCSTGRPAP